MSGHENVNSVGKGRTKRRKSSPQQISSTECDKCRRFYIYANELSYTHYEKCIDPWSCENLDVCDRCWHCRMVLCIQAGMVSQAETNICPAWRLRHNPSAEPERPLEPVPQDSLHARKNTSRISANAAATDQFPNVPGKRRLHANERFNSSEFNLPNGAHRSINLDSSISTPMIPRKSTSISGGPSHITIKGNQSLYTTMDENHMEVMDCIDDEFSESVLATTSLLNVQNPQTPGYSKRLQNFRPNNNNDNTDQARKITSTPGGPSRLTAKSNQTLHPTMNGGAMEITECSDDDFVELASLPDVHSPQTPGTSKRPAKSRPNSTKEKNQPSSTKQPRTTGPKNPPPIVYNLNAPCLIMYTDRNFKSIYKRHLDFATMQTSLPELTLSNQGTIFSLFNFYDWEWNKPDVIPNTVQRACWSVFQNQIGVIISDMTEFIESFPGLDFLKPKDRSRLIQRSSFEIAFTLQFLYMNLESNIWRGEKYFVLTLDQLHTIYPNGSSFFNDIFINSKRLEAVKKDHVALGLIAMALATDHTNVPIWSQEGVARVRGFIIEALKTLLTFIARGLTVKFAKILRIIRCLRRLGQRRQVFLESLRHLSEEHEELPLSPPDDDA